MGVIQFFDNNVKKKKKGKDRYSSSTTHYCCPAKPYGSGVTNLRASPALILWVRKMQLSENCPTGQATTPYHWEWQDSCLFPHPRHKASRTGWCWAVWRWILQCSSTSQYWGSVLLLLKVGSRVCTAHSCTMYFLWEQREIIWALHQQKKPNFLLNSFYICHSWYNKSEKLPSNWAK